MVHRGGYFRRRIVPTIRPGFGGPYPAHAWETRLMARRPLGGALHEVGGVGVGTLRTMQRCGLVAWVRGEAEPPERRYRLTDRGRQMAEEHRRENRAGWWTDGTTFDEGSGMPRVLEGFAD